MNETQTVESAKVLWVSGPVLKASGGRHLSMYEVVEVGAERLVGEVIELNEEVATVQVYEDTSGVKPGDPIAGQGAPLSVEIGPGLVGRIFDGMQRPLTVLQEASGAFIRRGVTVTALDRERVWSFTPKFKAGETIQGGDILGTVSETLALEHRVLVPPQVRGELIEVAPQGEYTLNDIIARVRSKTGDDIPLYLWHRWPVRRVRPYRERLLPTEPLITGQRVMDALFPLAQGGTAAIPGGFGTGKTITQHQLAKYADADIIVYIGCGERGNEMTEVLVDFPELVDPHSGRPLMERTVLIANTSNMPVAAREASIYTGITIAEYYRDMGYHVALMADSTSRWAEALREISGRLEEMPAEEGFPPYLPSRLAGFYERAGYVRLAGNLQDGSVTAVGAVSPPGGDFSEPVTQHTRRFVRCFWELNRELASARHFPAISWMDSYTGYLDSVGKWWRDNVSSDWRELHDEAMELLHEEDRLQQIVQLVGPDILADDQRLILLTARLLKEGLLQQNALDEIDTYATPEKQVKLLRAIIVFYRQAAQAIKAGCPVTVVQDLPVVARLMRVKSEVPNEEVEKLDDLLHEIRRQVDDMRRECQVDRFRGERPAETSGG
jgi:V/A-type H+-transporting ATPase subunit A